MKSNLKFYLIAILAIMCSSSLVSCGSDDDNNESNGGGASTGNNNAALVIGTKNFGNLPYAYFIDNGMDGIGRSCSLMFSNVRMPDGLSTTDLKWTYLAVRLPYDGSDIPVGKFSGSDVDLDFDVNHNIKDDTIELTGWSTEVTVEIRKSGDRYSIDVITSSLYTATDNVGNGQKSSDNIVFHYEGVLSTLYL